MDTVLLSTDDISCNCQKHLEEEWVISKSQQHVDISYHPIPGNQHLVFTRDCEAPCGSGGIQLAVKAVN